MDSARAAGEADPVAWVLRNYTMYDSTDLGPDGVVETKSGVRPTSMTIRGSEPPVEEPRAGIEVMPSVEAAAGLGGTIDLSIALAWGDENPAPRLVFSAWRAILEGEARDAAGVEAARQAGWVARTEEGSRRLEALDAWLAPLGAKRLRVSPWSAMAVYRVPTNILARLPDAPFVGIADVHTDQVQDECDIESAGDRGFTLHGQEFSSIIQTDQFYQGGWDGTGVKFGMWEGNGDAVYRDHPGLRWVGGVQRFSNCSDNGVGGCVSPQPNPAGVVTEPGAHATGVASILMGSIADGQDASFPANSSGALKRSGVARGATATGFSDFDFYAEYVVVPSRGFHYVNNSAGGNTDPLCSGAGGSSIQADSVFEADIGFFKSAGNRGSVSSTDCRLTSPAAALGAFTVGVSTWLRTSDSSVCAAGDADCAAFAIDTVSGLGGTSAEGRGRTLVDIVAPEGFRYPYPHYDRPVTADDGNPVFYRGDYAEPPDGIVGDDDGTLGIIGRSDWGVLGETSGATPVITGFAGVFREWFLDTYGTQIEDPAIAYANLLLMGDRWNGTAYATERVHNLWGAGAFRGRRFDAVGLDGPHYWSTGSVCVPLSADVDIPFRPNASGNPQALATGTDYVRVATWLYDSNFHDSTTSLLDIVDVQLLRSSDGIVWGEVARGLIGEERQVLFSDDNVSSKFFKLRLEGDLALSDDAGCGTDAARVYWAILAEDNSRDDANLPTCVDQEN
jgi:hypothetical protein